MYLAEQFRSETGLEADPLDDPEVLNDLFLQAERGKKTLTQRDKAPFRVTHAGQQARVELDKEKFEEITKHLVDRTIELTHEMLADARAKGHAQFDKIILVGGATRMPQVRNRLVAELNMEPEIYDPDESVAKGAALYALKESLVDQVQDFLATKLAPDGQPAKPVDLSDVPEEEMAKALDHLEQQLGLTLTGPVRELVNTRIVNVLSKSLGVVARNEQSLDVVYYLLPRNSEVPLERTSDFGTDAENLAAVDIRVMWASATVPTRSTARRSVWPPSLCPNGCRPRARSASSSGSPRTAGSVSRRRISRAADRSTSSFRPKPS
jgi:molecular chaperone DnaK (HSP70)